MFTPISTSESVEVSEWTEDDPVSPNSWDSDEGDLKVAEWSEWSFASLLHLHFKTSTETTLKSAGELRAESVNNCYKEIEAIVKTCGGSKMTRSRVKGLLALTSQFWDLLAETSKGLSIIRKGVQRRLNLSTQVHECINDPGKGNREILKKSIQQLLNRNDNPPLEQLLQKWQAIQKKIEAEEKRGKCDDLRRVLKNGTIIFSILACVAGIFLSLLAIPPVGAALSVAGGVVLKASLGSCFAVITPIVGAAIHERFKGPALTHDYFDHLQHMAQDSKMIEVLFTQIQIPSQEVNLGVDDLIEWKSMPYSKFFQYTIFDHIKALNLLIKKIEEIEYIISQNLRNYAEELYPNIFKLIR